jgi:hypothetical protein
VASELRMDRSSLPVGASMKILNRFRLSDGPGFDRSLFDYSTIRGVALGEETQMSPAKLLFSSLVRKTALVGDILRATLCMSNVGERIVGFVGLAGWRAASVEPHVECADVSSCW